MSVVEGGPVSTNLVQRVQNILLKPAAEWGVIEGEAATPQSLYLGYACILAAIPAVASFVGMQVFGIGLLGVSYHPPLISSLISGVVSYVLSLVGLFVMALIFDALAPSFDSQKSQIQALKVAVYSSTPGWVAGIVMIVPMLAILVLLASIYGLYLLWLGLPKLMKTPDDKKVGYLVVSLIVSIVVFAIIGAIEQSIRSVGMMGAMRVGAGL